MRGPRLFCLALLVGAMAGSPGPGFAVTAIVPAGDDQVIEKLPFPTFRSATVRSPTQAAAGVGAGAIAQPGLSMAEAAKAARQAVTEARQTGDTRYWGRAQALLAPWWDQRSAPATLAVLQATIQQGRHEFAAARQTLLSALAREPGNAQASLTLASLDRLAGRYADALKACDAVAQAGQPWYAQACRLETQSLQGQWAGARQGFNVLLATASDNGQVAWVASLLAESEERAGRDAAAAAAYQRSLQADPDLYTTLAYADLLLRTRTTLDAVLRLLKPLPETDAVLLRQALALRRLGQTEAWQAVKTSLAEREQALRQRGDDMRLHGREAALWALWLDDKPAAALALAQSNLELQKEPIDWWIALKSAQAAHDTAALAALQQRVQASGLKDQRLGAAALASGAKP